MCLVVRESGSVATRTWPGLSTVGAYLLLAEGKGDGRATEETCNPATEIARRPVLTALSALVSNGVRAEACEPRSSLDLRQAPGPPGPCWALKELSRSISTLLPPDLVTVTS